MNEPQAKPNPAAWEPVAAFACFAGSVLSLALGFAFTTEWFLNAVRHPFLHAVGITLLIIGIPILILGGHCLDLMEKKNKKSERVLQLELESSSGHHT
jgi:predicted Na+-dependent transporter